MWKIVAILLSALVLTGAAGLSVWPIGEPQQLNALDGNVQRGAYLARMAGCIACHTDNQNGGAPLAGGVSLKTDFGTFYSPNLTTDQVHGIGGWTIGDFAKAVRQGVSPEGAPYYPAFPYPFYAKLSDQDVADLWAAFQTVPPAAKPSRAHDTPFPFSFRPGVKLWRAGFIDFAPFRSDPAKSDTWNRGKYIVEGPGHCGACHTPRNLFGARQAELRLHGASGLPDGGRSPAITADRLREKGWAAADLAYALQTGILPSGDAFGGSMAEVVQTGTAFLTEDDRLAIATYLLDAE